MEILLLLGGLAFVLWYFVSRPKQAELRYTVHRDALGEARQVLEQLKTAAKQRRIKWPFNQHIGSAIEDLETHINETSTGMMGGRDLMAAVLQDVQFARMILNDSAPYEHRNRVSAHEYNKLFRELPGMVERGLMFFDAEDIGRMIEDAEAAVQWARDSNVPLKVPVNDAQRLVHELHRIRGEKSHKEAERRRQRDDANRS